jgi:hypothetical protein
MFGMYRNNGSKAQKDLFKYNSTGKGDPRRPQNRWKYRILI